MTNESPTAPPSTAEIQLDSTNGVVYVDGVAHPLTREQMRIFSVFARRRGGFVREDELRRPDYTGAAPGETIGRMPGPIRALIEGKRGPGGGRRLIRPARLLRPENTGEFT